MKFKAEVETPESVANFIEVLQTKGEVGEITETKTVIYLEADTEYDLGFKVNEIITDMMDELDISVTITRPVEVTETEEVKETGEVKVLDLTEAVKNTTVYNKEDAEELVKELKALHTAVEDKLKELAIDYKLHISLGDYGYGRSISGGWVSSYDDDPDWISSSYGC